MPTCVVYLITNKSTHLIDNVIYL